MDSLVLLRDARVTSSHVATPRVALPVTSFASDLLAVNAEASTTYACLHLDDTARIVETGNASADTPCTRTVTDIPLDAGTCVVDVRYLLDADALCAVLSNGDLLMIDVATAKDEDGMAPIECVGTVELGVVAAAWSPEEAVLAVVTASNTLLLLGNTFEPLCETDLHTADFGAAAPVNVGWGKKETQFHGMAGKAAAQADNSKRSVHLAENDNLRPCVSWRGDGAFFSVSSVRPDGDARVIRVYDREGRLQSTSEPVDRLEHALAWRPSGNLIAATQRLADDRRDVVFFERNGLRHGEFSLRGDARTLHVVDLQWNCDSSVLAVVMRDSMDAKKVCIELWSMANYHWYRKYVIRNCSAASSVRWDPEVALKMHYMDSDGCYRCAEFCWDVLRSNHPAAENAGTVAVIDGDALLLTRFRYCNVPPPYAEHTLKFEKQVIAVAFLSEGDGNAIGVLLEDGQCLFYGASASSKIAIAPTERHSPIQLSHSGYRQIAWPRENVLVGLRTHSEEECVDVFNIADRTHSTIALPAPARRLFSADGETFVETVRGDVHQVADSSLVYITSLPRACDWVEARRLHANVLLVGRSAQGQLFANSRQLCANCTSFTIHSDFLVYTTQQHYAHFIPLRDATCAQSEMWTSSKAMMRRVERGSRIVVAPPGDVSLVLVHPRGNLETVHPRPLVVARITALLDSGEYGAALIACRKHRVDMNLLYDHCPSTWERDVEIFIRKVDSDDYLNLFLTGLSEEDITKTLPGYVAASTRVASLTLPPDTSKVNRICDLMHTALNNIDDPRYFHALLMTYVRKQPQDLEGLLSTIVVLRRGNEGDAATGRIDAALRFVVVYVDVDALYRVALGMYDFALAILVAQHSHQDPREYLAYMSSVQPLPKYYQRFKIDDHLKRHERALVNLSRAGDEHFEEVLAYAELHNLFHLASDLYSSTDNAKFKRISCLHADALAFNGNNEDAYIAYMLAEEWQRAVSVAISGGMWREVFSAAGRQDRTQEELQSLALDVMEVLVERRKYGEAAIVALDYAQIPEEAIVLHLRAGNWSEAQRLAVKHGLRNAMLASHIQPAVHAAATQMLEDLEEFGEKFDKYRKRLVYVRTTPLSRRGIKEENEDGMDGGDDIDAFSDTDSVASRISVLSSVLSRLTMASTQASRYTSSSSRRRDERKKHRGKEGSVYEEDMLVDSLRKLMVRVDGMRDDVQALVRALLELGDRSEAKRIQHVYNTQLLSSTAPAMMREVFEPVKIRLVELPLPVKAQLTTALSEGGHDAVVDAVLHFLRPLDKPTGVRGASNNTWCSDLIDSSGQ